MDEAPLVIDAVSRGRQDAKALVVGILAGESPLSAKAIHLRIGKHLTYQAIHKALGLLQEGEVVTKHAGKYALSPHWLDELKAFYEKASRKNLPDLASLKPGTTTQVYFDSYLEAGQWFIEETARYMRSHPGECDCANYWVHMLPVTAFSGKYFEEMSFLFSQGRHYGVCKGSAKVDEFIAGYWRKTGKKFLLGEKIEDPEFIAIWDFLFHFYSPKEFQEELDKVHRNSKSESEGLAKATELFNSKKYKILCVVIHDKQVAQDAREKVQEIFKKRGESLA